MFEQRISWVMHRVRRESALWLSDPLGGGCNLAVAIHRWLTSVCHNCNRAFPVAVQRGQYQVTDGSLSCRIWNQLLLKHRPHLKVIFILAVYVFWSAAGMGTWSMSHPGRKRSSAFCGGTLSGQLSNTGHARMLVPFLTSAIHQDQAVVSKNHFIGPDSSRGALTC